MFEQTKVIKLNDLLFSFAPALTIVMVFLQFKYLGVEQFQTTLAMSLLILSIPTLGFYQLGKQSKRRLPISLQNWYRELEQSVSQQNAPSFSYEPSSINNNKEEGHRDVTSDDASQANKPNSRLTYMDLALMLKRLFSQR
jgi:uncharacterized protein